MISSKPGSSRTSRAAVRWASRSAGVPGSSRYSVFPSTRLASWPRTDSTPALLGAHRTAARDVLLLPGFDEIILGYGDRSMTLAPEHADRIVPGGNGVFLSLIH